MEVRKADRKQKKFATRLKCSKGIVCTSSPTKFIVLCNVGQATGLCKEAIHLLLGEVPHNDTLPKYIAEKGESHSYLIFSSIQSSEKFYNINNGKWKPDVKGPPVYMSYVENVPNTEIVCQYKDPQGLHIFSNFISNDEESLFLQLFDSEDDINSSNLKNRYVKHYGYEFRYGSNDVDLSSPLEEKIPKECDNLWARLRDCGINLERKPDQMTVNKYLPGQGIPTHVDKHSPFGDIILSLSLGSDVVMDWKHHSGRLVPILVPARSMLVMTSEARYDWQHGIQPRSWDPVLEQRQVTTENGEEKLVKVISSDTKSRNVRISLTFRWTRSGPCECNYKTLCDSVDKSTDNIEDSLASNLEELHVHQVYEKIAGHFSTTRHKPWPKVVEFMASVPPGAVVLDLGCGNGKNILNRNDILQIGGERSWGLLSECKSHVQRVPAADCVRLDLLHASLRDECADAVICIAVIHHFSSKVRRIESISTISRLLRPEGKALITVWAKDQTKSNYLCKSKQADDAVKNDEIHATVGGLSLPVHENRTQFQHNDLLVPWKLRNIKENKIAGQPESTLLRYYHVFEENELVNLCNEIPNLRVEKSFYEEGNWCVICKKI
ncbi:alkylated DNA repair protein alkB homolog 8 [Plutella xylostella]|uniref:alkylated DNA repair protein alkB homolog 8 n=1 Tax=Plutella xylostella TaxID=51655 RepID=UPI0020329A83|nr:alkylated DNA repair protein alkB homolog 8 [Plutella xylostella]